MTDSASAFWESEELLGEIVKGADKILVKKVSKRGREMIDIRTFWLNSEDEWQPSKKGIAIPKESLESLREILDKVEAS